VISIFSRGCGAQPFGGCDPLWSCPPWSCPPSSAIAQLVAGGAAPLLGIADHRHADVDHLDDAGDHDHRSEDPACDVVGVELIEDVHLGDPVLPGEALLEAGQREHAEESREADRHEPVLPLGEVATPERSSEDLRDDVVDDPHAEDRECAQQRQVRVRHHEVREMGELVERLERLERPLYVH
jgi:hypothetical protein